MQAAAGSPFLARSMLSEEGVDHFKLVNETLQSMLEGRCKTSGAMSALGEVDPDRLWTWLSLSAAERFRRNMGKRAVSVGLSQLQNLADRTRALLPSPVRKDLLLQDWLIQWARLVA